MRCVKDQETRWFQVPFEGGEPQPMDTHGPALRPPRPTPDGLFDFTADDAGTIRLFPRKGGDPVIPPWKLKANEGIAAWLPGGQLLVGGILDPLHARLDRVDLRTGQRIVGKTITPADPVGVTAITTVISSTDGQVVGYSQRRTILSDLLLVEGLD